MVVNSNHSLIHIQFFIPGDCEGENLYEPTSDHNETDISKRHIFPVNHSYTLAQMYKLVLIMDLIK